MRSLVLLEKTSMGRLFRHSIAKPLQEVRFSIGLLSWVPLFNMMSMIVSINQYD